MADFRINVIVDPSRATAGIKRVDNELNKATDSADRLRNSVRDLFAAFVTLATLRELIRLADTFTLLQNRIRTVTTTTEELNAVTNELFEIAQRTRANFEGTVEVYTRTALATRELGLSQRETLAFTESLNQAVALSGATTTEVTNALIPITRLSLWALARRRIKVCP